MVVGDAVTPPLIETRALAKTYRRGSREVAALAAIDLRIEAGESVAITGASGSGKSTLLGILGCLDQPSSGEYRLEGVPVSALDDSTLSRIRNRTIGFVFQSFHLIPQLSVQENVETPLLYAGVPEAEWPLRARRSLERVGLLARAQHLPGELSGGEAQRVAVARALVTDPRVLLADEPTGNLDSKTGAEIAGLLAELHREGRTVILVTHNEGLARRAERSVRLRDGRMLGPDVP